MKRDDSDHNQAIDHVVSHGFDPDDFRRRMSGLYGRVFERQVARIQSHLEGSPVEDRQGARQTQYSWIGE